MRNRILQRLENKNKKRFGIGGYKTNSIQYNMGGAQQLPGGMVEPIPGSDAVQFNGATHDQGGIMMDNITEVEDGETMDQVTMAKQGGKRDYFFSSHLKRGGVSFADQHKDILENGGTQEDIDYLAKMQEKAAGRKSGKVKAKLGGVVQYEDGGYPSEIKTERQKEWYDDQISKGKYWKDGSMWISEEGYNAAQEENKNNTESTSYTASANRGNKYKVQSYEVYGDEEGDYGDIADYQPGVDAGDQQFYAGKDDKYFRSQLEDEDARNAWAGNADPEVLKIAGVESIEDLNTPEAITKYQEAWNSLHKDNPIAVDGKFGEQTWRTATGNFDSEEEPDPDPDPIPDPDPDPDPIPDPEKKKDYSSTLLGLGSMIPAVMAFTDKPDYMENPDLVAPGVVKAERVAKQHLDRVDFNDQIARNASDAGAMNKFIETSGGGPANMANKMALYAKKQQGDREIKAQEARANIAIANEEANLDNKRKVFNSDAALDASKFNVGSQERAAVENTSNKMYVDEFNRASDAATKDRKLNAVQYGINTLASLHRDKLAYKAQKEYADAIDGERDALERFLEDNDRLSIKYGQKPTPTEEETEETVEESAKRGGYRKLNLMRKRYGK